MTTQQDYEGYQDLLVRLWDMDPESAGYLADIANDMPEECRFMPMGELFAISPWRNSPQGREYWVRLSLIMERNYAH